MDRSKLEVFKNKDNYFVSLKAIESEDADIYISACVTEEDINNFTSWEDLISNLTELFFFVRYKTEELKHLTRIKKMTNEEVLEYEDLIFTNQE